MLKIRNSYEGMHAVVQFLAERGVSVRILGHYEFGTLKNS